MDKTAKIFIAGHRGLVGAALERKLRADGFSNLLLRSRQETDLLRRESVEALFETERPEYVFLAAAKVGGILANNTYPADFIRDNLLIQTHVIDAAYRHGCKKLLFLGSSCIYPKLAPQPLQESTLLSGPLEATNEAYGIAKIAGWMMCQAYRRQHGFNAIGLMPTNLYGPGDNFDLQNSHVLPALIRRFHEAKLSGAASVTLWGSGSPKREFLHVNDLADAAVYLMNSYDGAELVNVGTGKDLPISELAGLVKEVVGYSGSIEWDRSKPDGTPRKVLDVSRLAKLGWKARTGLREGIAGTYQWYQEQASVRSQ